MNKKSDPFEKLFEDEWVRMTELIIVQSRKPFFGLFKLKPNSKFFTKMKPTAKLWFYLGLEYGVKLMKK